MLPSLRLIDLMRCWTLIVSGAAGSFSNNSIAQDPLAPGRLAATSDGKQLALAAPGKKIDVWDVESRKLFQSMITESPMKSVAFSPTGAHLIAGSECKGDRATVYLWEKRSGRFEPGWTTTIPDSCNAVAVSPDSKWVAAVSSTGSIYFLDMNRGRLRRTLHELGNEMITGAFLPDGSVFATGGQTLHLWDLPRADLSPEGHDRERLTDEESKKRERKTLKAKLGPMTVALSPVPNGQWVAAVGAFHPAAEGRAEELVLVEASTGQIIRTLADKLQRATALSVSSDSRRLVVGHESGEITIWDIKGYKPESRIKTTEVRRLRSVLFIPGSTIVAAMGSDGVFELWDVVSQRNLVVEGGKR
jgi:WD40 repeat protein